MSLRTIVFAACLLVPSAASAAVVWTGDFETGDFSQYNNLLNHTINGTDYSTIVEDVVVQGTYAARIELHDDARWSNGLRRVELHHSPMDGRTAEGATTFFAWSFYLPAELPSDPSQQIGYWESNSSYQQMMAFTLRGSDLSFVTRQPNNVVQWDGTGVATPAQWHRIAMKIVWSKDPGIGKVSVWFDGQAVVTDAAAKTLNDDNAHFTQVGLLRGDADFADVPVIYIDDAVEADSLEEVHPDLAPIGMEPTPTDMGAGPVDMGTPPTDMGTTSMPDAATANNNPGNNGTGADSGSIGGSPDSGSGGGGPSGANTADDGGCCSQVRPSGPRSGALALLAFVLVALRRRD